MAIANYQKSISTLLILSCGLLGVLVPGGPIETRNFSHIEPYVLGKFNTFLTALVMISVLITYYLLQNINWAYIVAAFCGGSYFIVYALDLAEIFPGSPDPMPHALFVIEVVGLIVSIPLVFLSVKKLSMLDRSEEGVATKQLYSKRFIYLALFLFFVSLSIIVFATKSAMGI